MVEERAETHVRRFRARDLVTTAASFASLSKTVELFERYLDEQNDGGRTVLLGLVGEELAGYVTVSWQPTYPPLAAAGLPEIQDLNVLPAFRRRGVGTALVGAAEREAKVRSEHVGIAVGLHPGYNTAQRLYVRLGYVPDGRGLTVHEQPVRELQTIVLDDSVVLHLEKRLV